MHDITLMVTIVFIDSLSMVSVLFNMHSNNKAGLRLSLSFLQLPEYNGSENVLCGLTSDHFWWHCEYFLVAGSIRKHEAQSLNWKKMRDIVLSDRRTFILRC